MEFLRNAYGDFGGGERFRVYEPDKVELLLDTFAQLFDVDTIHASPLGRALSANHALHDRPLGEVLRADGRRRRVAAEDLESQPTVAPGGHASSTLTRSICTSC